MFNAIDTSTSALVAQRVRSNTCAMNIAMADAVESPDGGPYQRRAVILSEGKGSGDRSGAGVHVSSIEKEAVYRYEYDPGHPYASEEGYVKLPGINPLVEMVNMMEASRAYEANVAAIDVSKSMLNSALRLLA